MHLVNLDSNQSGENDSISSFIPNCFPGSCAAVIGKFLGSKEEANKLRGSKRLEISNVIKEGMLSYLPGCC